jgi:hypothetical protein
MKTALAAAAVLFLSLPLSAHHSAALFDGAKEITIQGTVTEWRWANPHCILKFDSKEEGGSRLWAVETANPIGMTQRGWSRTSFKPGDPVTLTVLPARNGEPVGLLLTVTLADGTKLVGAPPPGTPGVRPPAP